MKINNNKFDIIINNRNYNIFINTVLLHNNIYYTTLFRKYV